MKPVWLDHYPEGVSHTIDPDEYANIPDLFDLSCDKYGDSPSFYCMGASLSFTELKQQAEAFAGFLQSRGLQPGDKIALQMPNLLQYPVAMFGAIKAGLVIVNTNPLYTETEMEHQFSDAGVKAIVILANFADKLEKVLKKIDIGTVVITELADFHPIPKRLLINTIVKYVKKMVPKYSIPDAISINQALKIGHQVAFTPYKADLNEVAFLQYTGGTTGVSKGAMLTHRNVLSNMAMISEWMKPTLEQGKEVVITALPLYHIFSLTVNCLSFIKLGGQNILITNPKDIPGFIKTLKTVPFTVFTGVNTLFNALMNHPEFTDIEFSKLKISVAGGMALQEAVSKRWKELTKTPIAEGYGLTETSPVATCNPIDGNEVVGSIGMPLPSTNVKLVDDDGNEVPEGERGELCISGPQVMAGYWNRPDETANTMLDSQWLKTGDIAVAIDNGFFKIVDRKKDMILVSGFNVFPNEVEDVLAKHEDVVEVAAVGVTDDKSGEAVKVFVVSRRTTLTADEVIEFSKTELVAYKRPKHVEFRTELPKTNVGKILRRALKE